MARFRVTAQGSRGEVSRLGHYSIRASVNGWNTGVEVEGGSCMKCGADLFEVVATGGSNRASHPVSIATVHAGGSCPKEAASNG